MRTGAVIAAAGMSSRMKAFKPLLPLGGSTIIGTAVDTLKSAGINEIAIVTGNNAKMLEKYLASSGVTCLCNENYASTDMFTSAKIGLSYIKGRCGRVFFLPGDAPLFTASSLFAMQEYMDTNIFKILLPVYKGKLGHPILINADTIPELINYKGSGGLKGAIDGFSGSKGIIGLDDAGMTLDADRPEDYEKLREYVRKHKF